MNSWLGFILLLAACLAGNTGIANGAVCDPSPCRNGGACIDFGGRYFCICVHGFSGRNCEIVDHPCDSNPCMNNATCEELNNNYTCTCAPFYSGVNCETEIRPCRSGPCMNGATCMDNFIDSYTCICQAGYTGQDCQTDIDECASGPCMNNATCEQSINEYSCTCAPFFSGVNCETEIRPCRSGPCMNGATCMDNSIDSYTCICQAGYTGQDCETDIDECASGPCMNNATCEQSLNKYSCTCAPFFSGVNCETEIRPCRSGPCMNGATCMDNSIDSYTCICQAGYTGQDCETDIDECASGPCMNNATCEQSINEYSCTCAPFFSGVNCETEIRPCRSGPCMNGATCMDNSIDSYTCICQAGYTGQDCETDIDECASGPCMNNATCEQSINEYSCTCAPFFSGVNCETEIRPCRSGPCMNGATCMDNSIDSYTCICQAGYTGQDCESDIDECASGPCMNNATCEQSLNEYSCTCAPFFSGVNCETEIRPCWSGPCMNGATCMDNSIDSYTCICQAGYTGQDCQTDIDECASGPCMNNATCEQSINEYSCTCAPFFSGVNCETEIRPCRSGPCMNGATCMDNSIDSYTCICQAGYTGQDCETDIDECASGPCMNNATCEQSLNEYSCTCAPFFSGVNCETEIRPCRSGPCMNGATCMDNSINSYTCICQAGYTGQDCETDISECASDPCMNNATCVDMPNEYSCTCPAFYSGVNCETEIRPCRSGPCMNGATCMDNSIDSYTCICQAGYTGQDCESDMNECASNPCMNDATCEDMLNEYSCVCPEFYTGVNCETETRPCTSDPCVNGATCTDIATDFYVCFCAEGFTGTDCETEIRPCMSVPCMNGATCTDVSTDFYVCFCREGFTGTDCETDVNECLDSPCANGGTCVNEIGGYRCTCDFPWEGTNCTDRIDFCALLPCMNDGTCVAYDFYGLCTCAENYEGVICQVYTGPPTTTLEPTTMPMPISKTTTPAVMPTEPQGSTLPEVTTPSQTQGPIDVKLTTMEATTLPVTSIEDFFTTTEPTNTTITVYTQRPARIDLLVETDTPAISTDFVITTVPENAIAEIVNETEIGLIILSITTSAGAYTTIVVSTMEPSDMFLVVETVDAENTAALAFGILNITLPTTETPVVSGGPSVSSTQSPGVTTRFMRALSTTGSALVEAAVTTTSPANFTLVIVTGNPNQTANVSFDTVPGNAAYDVQFVTMENPDTVVLSFKTSEAVNVTWTMNLMEMANISLIVDTLDDSHVIVLEEKALSTQMPTRPVVESFVKYLSTQGSTVVRASASTTGPANYTLVIYTRNPGQNALVNVMQSPPEAIFDLMGDISFDPDALTMTFRSSEAANVDLLITLLDSANVSFQVDTTDQSSVVVLAEDTGVSSTMQPGVVEMFLRYLSTQESAMVRASASTASPANYTLVIYTRNPGQTANVSLMTSPSGVAFDVMRHVSVSPDALTMTFRTSEAVDATVLMNLLESANISLRVDTADQSSEVVLAEDTGVLSTMQPTVVESFLRSLSTQGSTVVRASASTASPANYTLVIYTRNPGQTANVSLMTSPDGAAFDVMRYVSMDPAALMMTFRTSEAVNATILMNLLESANITLRVDTADQSSVIILSDDTGASSTAQPMSTYPVTTKPTLVTDPVVYSFDKAVFAMAGQVYRVFVSTSGRADYTLTRFKVSPEHETNVSIRTIPNGAAMDDNERETSDALTTTFKTFTQTNTTVFVTVREGGIITFKVETTDGSALVTLTEFTGVIPTIPMTVEPTVGSTISAEPGTSPEPMVTSKTTGPSDRMTSPQTSLGATMSPEPSASQPMMTSQTMIASDQMTSQQVSMSSQPMMTSQPPIVETTVRSLSTRGPSVVKAFASTENPANYTLVIYTRDPERTVNVSYVTDPDGAMYDAVISFDDDPESLTMTFKTQEAVDTTVMVSLLESANVTFQVDTADPSSAVMIALDGDMTSMQPPASTSSMSAEPSASQTLMMSQTMGPSDQMTSQQTSMGATMSPEPSASQPMMTSQTMGPSDQMTSQQTSIGATMSAEPSASQPMMTSQTMGPSDKMTSQQVSMSSQPMMTSQPQIVETTVRSLSTQGPSVVKAFASTINPANYTLVIYTRDPERTVNVSYVTDPDGAMYDAVISFDDDPESLTMTFKTQEAVDTTVIVSLLESANVTFQVDTADPSSAVMLALDGDMTSMQPLSSTSTMSAEPSASQPMMTSQTMGPSDQMTSQQTSMGATMSAEPSASQTMMMSQTMGPSDQMTSQQTSMGATMSAEPSASQPMMTSQTMGPSDRMTSQQTSMGATMSPEPSASQPMMTSQTMGPSDKMTSQQVSMSSQPMMTSQPQIVETTIRSLSTQGPAVVKAFASTRFPANYTLVIYARNPESVNVTLETDPAGVAYDIEGYMDDDPESLVTTFTTSQAVGTTLVLGLVESANITFQVDTADPFVIVELEEDTGSGSTMQPSPSMTATMSPATGPTSQTMRPSSSVTATMSPEPGESSQPMTTRRGTGTDEMTSQHMASTMSSGPATPPRSTVVSQTVPVSDMMTTPSSVEGPLVKTLSTQGSTTVRASVSAASLANYTLVVYTRDPLKTVNVTIVTIPSGAAFDIMPFTNDEVLTMTFKTSGAVDTTVFVDMFESANISFRVDTEDQSSMLILVEETGTSSTMQPAVSTQMPTEPMVVQSFIRFLSTQGTTVVRASASTGSPANYTLVVYTTNPGETANVSIITVPSGAAFEVMSRTSNDPEALMLTFRTVGSVDTDLIISLLESANVSLQVDSADQSSEVVLAEETAMSTMRPVVSTEVTTGPEVVESFTRLLRTEGSTTVTAFASTQKPANYTLLVFTRNADTANITIETDPVGLAYDEQIFRGSDFDSVLMSFRTLESVNTTVTIQLLESANISFTVSTSDQSISLKLSEGTDIVSTIQPTVSTGMSTEPSIRTLTETFHSSGNTTVRACASARESAVHTLLVHTRNPSLTASVRLEADPPGVACFPQIMRSNNPEALMIILRPSEEVKATFIITLLESANITLTTETEDPSPTIEFIVEGSVSSTMQPMISASTPVSPTEPKMTSETIYPTVRMTSRPQVAESFVRSLSTTGNSTVRASVSTLSPATYTLVIYTKNPGQTADVTLNTIPANVSYDVEREISDNPAALTMTFKTSDDVNTTIIMNLLESANISLQVDTADLESVVSLVEVMDIGVTVPSPTQTPGSVLMLSTNRGGVVEAYAATNDTAILTLVVFTENPTDVDVSIVTQPADLSTGVTRFIGSDGRSVAILITVPEPANTTVRVLLTNAANISLQVDTKGDYVSRLVEVTADVTTAPEVTDNVVGPTTEVPSTVPSGSERVTLVRELMTSRPGTFNAVVSTPGPGNYSLVINVPNPGTNTRVTVTATPQGSAQNYRVSYSDNPEAFSFQFMTVVASNTTLFLTLLAPANISLTVETVGSSSTAEIVDISQPVSSTSAPTTSVTTGMATKEGTPAPLSNFFRELATTGPAEVQATASSDGPAYFEFRVSIPNPSQTTVISILTVPQGLLRDLDSDSPNIQNTQIVRFKVLSAALTIISATLKQAANVSFRVETTDSSAEVQLSDNSTEVAVTSSPTQPAATTTPSTPTPSTPAPSTAGPSDSFTISRMLSVPAGATVQASASLDRPANISFVIYTMNPAQVTGISVQTTPQGVARNFVISTLRNPERYVMHFTTSAASTADLVLPTIEAGNVSFSVTLQGQESSSNLVDLFIVGGPTMMPPTASPTPVVFVNTTRSLQIMGPSQTSLLINARSAASVVVDVSGLAEFNVSFFKEGAVQIQQTTSSQEGSSLRLLILSPVNITVMIAAQDEVEILATVMSTQPDAALVTIVTESETPTTSQPTVSPVTPETPGTLTVVRTLQTYSANSTVKAMASTTRPANLTVEVFTPNPSGTFTINIQTVPSGLAVDFNIFMSSDQDKMTYMFKTLEASETTVLMMLAEPGNISFTVTNVDDASMVTLINPSVTPEVMNVTRTITTTGAATSLVSIRTFEPSVIYLVINGSAEISLAAEPRGSVQTETPHMLGSSVLKLTTTVPANVTLFVTTGQAVVIQTIVESANPGSAVILLEGEIEPTNQPPPATVVMTSPQTQRKGDPMILNVPSIESGETTVAWRFSPSDEPFIMGFILQYREANSSVYTSTPLIPASARNYTLTNLRDNTVYVVRVIAVDRAAASFHKPVLTLSRDIMDPVPGVEQQSETKLDLFHWVLIGSAVLVVILLIIAMIGLLVCLRRKPKKNVPDGAENPAVEEETTA
ncbi:mucin-17-like isoform X19 [Patiria miniata]|uniref:Uncharacterized protein n=1 Tax=Patiria miniata TaxID=46514 RepID=A0A914AWQ0_PATMI|nr:mucin-17-like isoform X19 [Patiria miniata]